MPAPKRRSKSARPELEHRPRPKNGRQQLRNVTRTARRDQPEAHLEENSFPADSESEPEQGIEPQAPEFDKTKAYDALLTLLSADHKEPSVKRRKTIKSSEIEAENGVESAEEKEEEEEDEEEVAGFNLKADEDDDEEVEEAEAEDEKDISLDPFEVHFNNVTDDYAEKQHKLIVSEKQKWPIKTKLDHESIGYTSLYQIPPGEKLGKDFTTARSAISGFNIKKRVLDAYSKEFPVDLTELELAIAEPMLGYKDLSYPYRDAKHKLYKKLYTLHALNHIYKTRDRILKNNDKLHSYQEKLKNGSLPDGVEEPELRDQGFTRPKVLILLPTRNAAQEVVELLIKLSGSEQQENRKKFNAQFFSKDSPPANKPEDFIDAFKGNSNDFFCLGIKFTRKTIKLYSSFYSSDIIVASPIGLSMILENPDKKKRQYDFLSSIEVLIVDKTNQIEMQNWDHVSTVLKYVNKIPKDFHDADFSRIRMFSINDQASLFRQTLVFSEYLTPNINSLITKSHNVAGKYKFKPVTTPANCIMNSIGLKLRQIFQRFESGSPQTNPEARFKFFTNSVLPSLMRANSYDDGLLIYIPSYYDYLRVRNYMKTSTKINFGSIDEYSSRSKLTRTRHEFSTGKIKVLLYTERLHYFRRYEIAGTKNLLMYELPSNPLFYKELLKFVGTSVFKEIADIDLSFIKVLYSKWDALSLERIVGNKSAPVLCNSVNEMYEFR